MFRFALTLLAGGALVLCAAAIPVRAWDSGPALPGPRKDVAVAVDGDRILVFGGRTTGNALLASSHALDSSTDTWATLAAMPEARGNAACVRVGGFAYVFGGFTPTLTASALRYEIATDTWSAIAPMPAANGNMACAAVAGKIYLFGGGHDGAPLDVAWCYEPATDSWSALTPLPHARKSCVAVAIGERIHVIGGHTAHSGVNDATDWVDVYDPATGAWSAAPSLPVPLTCGAAAVRNGRIWLAGGIDGSVAYGKFAEVWSYAPGELAWSAENPLPDALGGAIAVTTAATSLYVLGGSDAAAEGVATVYRQFLTAPDIVTLHDVPNDQGGRVGLRWLASLLDTGVSGAVDSYWVWREVPLSIAARALAAGARLLGVGERPAASPGRQFKAEPFGAGFIYWEYVGAQVAHGFPAYSFIAPTEFDSLPDTNPLTRFMVEAEDLATGDYWQSSPRTGYSVDNLAPPAPGPLASRFEEAGLVLSWRPSEAADLAGYRVYRGATDDFEPGDADWVATVAETSYTSSHSGACFFKVRPVDVHGNEGPPSTALANTLDADLTIVSGVLLAAPFPNPARHSARLHYALARESVVRLAVHDVGGRVVRVLEAGLRPAGAHSVSFDLHDGGGARLAAGLYFLRLETSQGAVTKRLVVGR